MLGLEIRAIEALEKESDSVLLEAARGGLKSQPIVKTKSQVVGRVSRFDTQAIFVPGSITCAKQSGEEMEKIWEARAGEKLAWVNSNMPITDYPRQIFRTDAAKQRDNLVEIGIMAFIGSTPYDHVEILAHSAGSAQALKAAARYKQEGGKKHLTVVTFGAGSPGVIIGKAIKTAKELGIEVHNVVDKDDVVPMVSGSISSRVYRRDAESLFEGEKIGPLEPSQTVTVKGPGEVEVVDKSELVDAASRRSWFTKALGEMTKGVDAHHMDKYMEAVHKRVVLSRASRIVLNSKTQISFDDAKSQVVQTSILKSSGKKKPSRSI